MQNITVLTEVRQQRVTDIPVPCFMRSKDEKEYIGVLDAKTVVTVFNSDNLIIVKNSSIDSNFIKEEIVKAHLSFHSCTETEFIEAYDKAIEDMRLHPKLAI